MAEEHELLQEEAIPVIVANDLGMIVRVNKMFEDTFNWKESVLVGKPISNIIPDNLKDAHNMAFSRFRMSGNSTLLETPLDLEILKGDGEVVTTKHYIAATQEHGEKVFVASIVFR
jgi:PAS domain S-box-containing protein